jgi:hypothetical protein
MEVGLIDDLPRENRLPASRLHLHPFKGRPITRAKLTAHYYPVDRPCAHTRPVLSAAVQYLLSLVHSRAVCPHPSALFP